MDIHNRADDEDNSDDAENDSLVVFPDIGFSLKFIFDSFSFSSCIFSFLVMSDS
jgi:hypothetical protein